MKIKPFTLRQLRQLHFWSCLVWFHIVLMIHTNCVMFHLWYSYLLMGALCSQSLQYYFVKVALFYFLISCFLHCMCKLRLRCTTCMLYLKLLRVRSLYIWNQLSNIKFAIQSLYFSRISPLMGSWFHAAIKHLVYCYPITVF